MVEISGEEKNQTGVGGDGKAQAGTGALFSVMISRVPTLGFRVRKVPSSSQARHKAW